MPWESFLKKACKALNFLSYFPCFLYFSLHFRLVLLAYMRTGSSLLGEILRWHSDVFYLYEPFRVAEFADKMSFDQIDTILNEWMQRLVSCDFSDLTRIDRKGVLKPKRGLAKQSVNILKLFLLNRLKNKQVRNS